LSLHFKHRMRWISLFILVILAAFSFASRVQALSDEQQAEGDLIVVGQLLDPQGEAVVEATITAILPGDSEAIVEVESLEDGYWFMPFTQVPREDFQIKVEHPHFMPQTFIVGAEARAYLAELGFISLDALELERRITPAFWAATLIFLGILLLIAFERLHSTTAALAGLSAVFLVTYIGGTINPGWYIFSFERGLSYINWEVIFLIMGMMIIIAIIEGTGIFQWMAFQSYRVSRGRIWLLALILMAVTAVASALLDNFTTMLLMTPISLQIALALGINPLALIIPEILASNVGGISTLVGTPTNILIGAYAGIGFTDFLVNQTTGVVIALIATGGYVLFHYRSEFRQPGSSISPALYEKLEENARIEDPESLWKASLVFSLVLIGFVLGEMVHAPVAAPAMMGATLLLIWLKPDVHQMIKAVDWTTLVFFMALFVVVGAIQEVGLLGFLASGMSRVIGENLALGVFMIIFGVGTLSVAIANIPLAASMLPIVKFLTATVPGAQSQVFFYALSMGAAMGLNVIGVLIHINHLVFL